MKTSASKRRTLQSLAGMFPCNAILYKWKIASSPACSLCGHATETLSHVQCVCPALKEARIRAHHNLVTMLWGRLEKASSRWCIHQEMTVDALCGLEAPLDCYADWQRAVDELQEPGLEAEEDPASSAGLLRKRPDGFAFNWDGRSILILEFSGAYDWMAHRHGPPQDKTIRASPRQTQAHVLSPSWMDSGYPPSIARSAWLI